MYATKWKAYIWHLITMRVAADLQITRKSCIQRFLEKHHERIHGKSLYLPPPQNYDYQANILETTEGKKWKRLPSSSPKLQHIWNNWRFQEIGTSHFLRFTCIVGIKNHLDPLIFSVLHVLWLSKIVEMEFMISWNLSFYHMRAAPVRPMIHGSFEWNTDIGA